MFTCLKSIKGRLLKLVCLHTTGNTSGGRRPLQLEHHLYGRSFSSYTSHVSLIQGANRGIGYALTKHLLENNAICSRAGQGIVLATCRNPSEALDLQELRNKYKDRLEIFALDLLEEDSIRNLSNVIKEQFGRLDLMINCSAVLHLPNGEMVPETSIARFNPEAAIKSFRVNAIGATLMMKHFHELMLITANANAASGHPIPVIANISARVSSIGDNHLGGWYSYRGSKAALNQLTKTASVEFGRKKNPIVCVLLHPGTVETRLSEPFQKSVPKGKLFTPEYSAEQLLRVVDGLKLESNGHFYDFAGVEIVW